MPIKGATKDLLPQSYGVEPVLKNRGSYSKQLSLPDVCGTVYMYKAFIDYVGSTTWWLTEGVLIGKYVRLAISQSSVLATLQKRAGCSPLQAVAELKWRRRGPHLEDQAFNTLRRFFVSFFTFRDNFGVISIFVVSIAKLIVLII